MSRKSTFNWSILAVSIMLSTLTITACGNKAAADEPSSSSEHEIEQSTQDPPDWAGTYRTILPCADCGGIKTEVLLYKTGVYQMNQKYIGKSNNLFIQRDNFKWLDDGKRIQFETNEAGQKAYKYEIDEDALWLLDKDGNKITGDGAESYRLEKVNPNHIIGKTWNLVNIADTAFSKSTFDEADANLMLGKSSTISMGDAGCNIFRASYQINEKDSRIRFSDIIRTKKSCPFIELENDFISALEKSASYQVAPDKLQLLDDHGKILLGFKYDFFD